MGQNYSAQPINFLAQLF